MLDIRFKTGSEGPHHDPYAYEEWTIKSDDPRLTDPDLKLTIHYGLGEWFQLSSVGYTGFKFLKNHLLEEQWGLSLNRYIETVSGYTFEQIKRIYRKVNRPFCRECMVYPKSNQISYEQGYPGEELLIHSKCGNIIAADQDMSYII